MDILKELDTFITTALKNGSTVMLGDLEISDFTGISLMPLFNDCQRIQFTVTIINRDDVSGLILKSYTQTFITDIDTTKTDKTMKNRMVIDTVSLPYYPPNETVLKRRIDDNVRNCVYRYTFLVKPAKQVCCDLSIDCSLLKIETNSV